MISIQTYFVNAKNNVEKSNQELIRKKDIRNVRPFIVVDKQQYCKIAMDNGDTYMLKYSVSEFQKMFFRFD